MKKKLTDDEIMVHSINSKAGLVLDGQSQFELLLYDINDTDNVMAQQSAVSDMWNTTSPLQTALFKRNGKYYFFNANYAPAELRKDVDDEQFICPYCKSPLQLCNGSYNEILGENNARFVRHIYTGEDSPAAKCILNTGNDFEKKRKKYFKGEGMMHKKTKIILYRMAKEGILKLNVPCNYMLNTNSFDYTYVDLEYKEVTIVDAVMEKQVLNKDYKTNGYRPDIIFYTDTGEEIYCEITCANGKTVNDYYDIWHRLNKTVVEVRYYDNRYIINALNEDNYTNDVIDDDEVFHDLLIASYETNFRYLYDPVINKARKAKDECDISNAHLRDIDRLNILRDIHREALSKKLNRFISRYAKRNNLVKLNFNNKNEWCNRETGEVFKSVWKTVKTDEFLIRKCALEGVWNDIRSAGYIVLDRDNLSTDKYFNYGKHYPDKLYDLVICVEDSTDTVILVRYITIDKIKEINTLLKDFNTIEDTVKVLQRDENKLTYYIHDCKGNQDTRLNTAVESSICELKCINKTKNDMVFEVLDTYTKTLRTFKSISPLNRWNTEHTVQKQNENSSVNIKKQ